MFKLFAKISFEKACKHHTMRILFLAFILSNASLLRQKKGLNRRELIVFDDIPSSFNSGLESQLVTNLARPDTKFERPDNPNKSFALSIPTSLTTSLSTIKSHAITSNNFVFTKRLYNGTVTYNGMFAACDDEYVNSVPCNSFNLLNGNYWTRKYVTSWVFSLENYDWQGNCQAYTTDDEGNMGTCLMSEVSYITQCSCDEYFPICCYKPQ